MGNKNIITKQGLDELKIELKNLVEVERPKVIEEIKDARALGDLSENAEFDAARQRQGEIEDRVREIENIIENSVVQRTKTKSKTAGFGSEITFQDLSDKSKSTVTIVSSLEADPFEGKISDKSPLGIALVGSEEGDLAVVEVAKKYEIKITKINN